MSKGLPGRRRHRPLDGSQDSQIRKCVPSRVPLLPGNTPGPFHPLPACPDRGVQTRLRGHMPPVLALFSSMPWWAWTGFLAFVALMLALDLGVFNRRAHVVSLKEALAWCAVWFGLAIAFNLLIALNMPDTATSRPALELFT